MELIELNVATLALAALGGGSLEDLDLEHFRLGGDALPGLPALRRLRLWRCEGIGDAAIAAVGPRLAALELYFCSQLTDAALDFDGARLTRLEVVRCPGITEAARALTSARAAGARVIHRRW